MAISVSRSRPALAGPYSLTAEDLTQLERLAGVPVVAKWAQPFQPSHTYGGKLIDKVMGSQVPFCTTGFTVKDAVSQLTGVMTAGHCSDDYWANGDPTYHESPAIWYVVDFSGLRWDRNQDFAWYQTSHVEYPKFWDGFGLRTQTGTQPRLQMEDNVVCHYGIGSDNLPDETGYSCGVVDSITLNPGATYCNGGPCDAIWVLVIPGGHDLECEPGDSGGPYFWGNIAWGIQSGCNFATGDSVFMSIGALQWDGVNTRVLLP